MALDLDRLTRTTDIRVISTAHAQIVRAIRYAHVARRRGCYDEAALAGHLGGVLALRPFQVFLEELGHAWPEPIRLNPHCLPTPSYDEMLITDLAGAAALADRPLFGHLLEDMLSPRQRALLWSAARRLMRALRADVREE